MASWKSNEVNKSVRGPGIGGKLSPATAVQHRKFLVSWDRTRHAAPRCATHSHTRRLIPDPCPDFFKNTCPLAPLHVLRPRPQQDPALPERSSPPPGRSPAPLPPSASRAPRLPPRVALVLQPRRRRHCSTGRRRGRRRGRRTAACESGATFPPLLSLLTRLEESPLRALQETVADGGGPGERAGATPARWRLQLREHPRQGVPGGRSGE